LDRERERERLLDSFLFLDFFFCFSLGDELLDEELEELRFLLFFFFFLVAFAFAGTALAPSPD